MPHPLPPRPVTNHSSRKASTNQNTAVPIIHNTKNQEQQITKKSKVSGKSNVVASVPSNTQKAPGDVPSYFTRVSPDVFSQIASRLLASDLLSLARTSKSLRKILMSRSSAGIWRAAMSNVDGLPPCPSTISEPRYAMLMLTLLCTSCGANAFPHTSLNAISLVRLCTACRREQTMQYCDISMPDIRSLFPLRNGLVLRSQVAEEIRLFQEVKASGDANRLEVWKREKAEEAAERNKFASQVEGFTTQQQKDHKRREREVRHAEIKRRLKQLGWSDEDMVFPNTTERQWLAQLSHNTPLTDKHWNKIKPKLITLLQANREGARARGVEERRKAQRTQLKALWDTVKVGFAGPNNPVTSSQTLAEAVLVVSRLMPVPEASDVAEWPIIKKLLERDVSLSEMQSKLAQRRAELDQEVFSWGNSIKKSLAEMLRQKRAESGDPLDSPIVGTIGDGLSAGPFKELSPDMQLLVRADSIFSPHDVYSFETYSESPFHFYDTFIRSMRQYRAELPLDTTRFKIHWTASGIAHALLKSLGRPMNTSILELQVLDERFVCGRCNDNKPKSWLEIIQYYVEQANAWEKAQSSMGWFDYRGIAMHNVHDLRADHSKPLVRLLAPDERAALETAPARPEHEVDHENFSYVLMCGPCLRSFACMDITTRPRLIQHLRDVHEIVEPLLDDPKANLPEVKNHNFQTVYTMHLWKGKYEHDDHGDDPWWNSDSDEGDEGDSEDNNEDEE